MSPHSREKIPTECTKCGRINLIRRDYLKTLTHPYWCSHCRPVWRPKTFEDRTKLSLAHRKYNLDESFFEKIDSEEKAYWLGFFSGDGAITDKNRIRITLNIKDGEHLKKFREVVKWTGKDYYHRDTNAVEVNFRSLKMVRGLKQYYITSRKTFTVKFPYLPTSFERHFIRGVFDADGCISRAIRLTQKNSGHRYLSYGGEFGIEGNREFVSAIQSRLIELGLPCNSINYPGKTINRLRYGGINQLKKIYQYLYENATIFLERKKKVFEDVLKNYHCKFIKQPKKELKLLKLAIVK